MKRIAFDLDNTLIRSGYDFPIEKPKRRLASYFVSYEPLREGITELVERCAAAGYRPCVYTSSYRSVFYIKRMFWLYKIKLDIVVNQAKHDAHVRVRSSKYPPAFNIDILVDDSPGLSIEGERFHFNTIIIQPENNNWHDDVYAMVEQLNIKATFNEA